MYKGSKFNLCPAPSLAPRPSNETLVMAVPSASTSNGVSSEADDWYSELEHPEEFYSNAVKYWEVGYLNAGIL